MLHVLDLPLNGQQLQKLNSNDDLTYLQRALTVFTILCVLFTVVILILVIVDGSNHPRGMNHTTNEMDSNNTEY